jgi:hypothetical protein
MAGKRTSPASENVTLLDEDVDGDADISSLIRASRGEGHTPRRSGGEYRRQFRSTEDGYGELDFA